MTADPSITLATAAIATTAIAHAASGDGAGAADYAEDTAGGRRP
jgi:hypothetical protein